MKITKYFKFKFIGRLNRIDIVIKKTEIAAIRFSYCLNFIIGIINTKNGKNRKTIFTIFKFRANF
jgi:hypothetical protein